MPAEIIWRQGSIVKVRARRTGRIRWGYVKSLGGKRHRASDFGSRKHAEDALDALIYEHHMRRLGRPVPPPPVTLQQLIDLYLTDARDRGVTPGVIRNSGRTLERFRDLLPRDIKLTEITAEDLRRYRSARLEEGRHPHTIKFELKRLRTAFLSARRLFEIQWEPPIQADVKAIHHGREVVLSHGQISNLLAAAQGTIRDFILLGLHTAMRAREILTLTRRQIDLTEGIDSAHGRLRLIGKNRKEDSLPLTAQASAILTRRLGVGGRPEDQVFTEGYHAIRRAFKRSCADAGVPYGQPSGDVVIHTLRHSAASYLADQGTPVHILKAITRHSSAHALMIYTHASARAVGEAIERLGEISD